MFPIIRKDNRRVDHRLAWSVFVLLNVGMILCAIFERWRSLEPGDLNGIGLALSALLAGYLFVFVC